MLTLALIMGIACGTLQTGTAAAGNTVSVTGLPFNPSAHPALLLLSWSGRTATGQAEGDHKFGMGYAISTTDRGGSTSQSDHGIGTAATDAQVFDDSCIKLLTVAGAVDGAMDFDAWLPDGFRLIIDDAFAADYIINWMLISDPNLQVESKTITTNTVTGDQTISSFSFQPNAAIAFGCDGDAINTTGAWSNWFLGVAAGGTPTNYILYGTNVDAQGNSICFNYCRAGEFICYTGTADSMELRSSITAWLSNGFTLNISEAAGGIGAAIARVVALRGINIAVGDLVTATNTTPFSETGLAFNPSGFMFASHCQTQSTSDTTQAGDQRSVGFCSGASSRNCVGIHDKDAANTMDIGVAQRTDCVYINQDAAATVAIEGLMDFEGFGNSGDFTVVMDDADPSAAFVWYMAFGLSDSPVLLGRPFGRFGESQMRQIIAQ